MIRMFFAAATTLIVLSCADHRVVSHKTQKVVADGDALVVIVDYRTGRPVDIPPSVRASMDEVAQI